MSVHRRARPGWDCERCHRSWPCHPARAELGREYGVDRPALATYMCAQLHDAVRELPGEPVGALYFRFIAWTR